LKNLILFAFVMSLSVIGCKTEEPAPNDVITDTHVDQDTNGTTDTVVTPDIVGDTDTPASCLSCIAAGQTFLFRSLNVTEPAEPPGLAQLLNDIWSVDFNYYRLNVLVRIDEVMPQEDGTLIIKTRGGSAWHNLPFADVAPVEHENVPTSFYFNALETASDTIYFTVDKQCNFVSINNPDNGNPPSLGFRPGPEDRNLLCSNGMEEENVPKHTVPIRGLYATGKFNDTCTGMDTGTLTGCISEAAACQLCFFLLAPDYSLIESTSPDPLVTPVVCQAAYCEHYCGAMPWSNFGGIVQGFEVPLNCDLDGDSTNEAFRLTATFNTIRTTYADPE
jgi:hypothetical protein